jgi:hypothetical protein
MPNCCKGFETLAFNFCIYLVVDRHNGWTLIYTEPSQGQIVIATVCNVIHARPCPKHLAHVHIFNPYNLRENHNSHFVGEENEAQGC